MRFTAQTISPIGITQEIQISEVASPRDTARAMSEENVEIVRRAYAALAEEGVEAMLAFTGPQFEMTTPSSLATEPDTYRGHDGVRRWFDSFSDALEGVYLEGQEFRATGDQVFVVTRLRGRGRSTGIDVEQQAFLLWTLRDGLVVRGDVFAERGPALEAAGLSELWPKPD